MELNTVDWTAIGASVTTIITAVIMIWKYKNQSKRENVQLTEEETTSAIRQWQIYARQREAIHKQDMLNMQLQLNAHKNEINELRESERDCQIKCARQEEQLLNCNNRITELENRMKESGMLDNSHEHKPLDN